MDINKRRDEIGDGGSRTMEGILMDGELAQRHDTREKINIAMERDVERKKNKVKPGTQNITFLKGRANGGNGTVESGNIENK